MNGNTVASNVVTEATGAAIVAGAAGVAATAPVDAGGPFGYLSEGARTNLFLWASDWTNVAWVKTTMTTAFTSTGPDGVPNSATRLTATGALSTALQLLVAAASDRTWSVWVRRVTGTGTIKLFQGATKTADLASQLNSVTYTRISQDATVDITILGAGIEIGTSGDAVDVWVGQFEAGAFASSPIPTTTVAVIRAADVLTYPAAGNLSSAANSAASETWYAEIQQGPLTATTGVFLDTLSGAPDYRTTYLDASSIVTSLHDTAATTATATAISAGVVSKTAMVYNGSTLTSYRAGVGGTAVAMGAQAIAPTTLYVGSKNNSLLHIFGTIRNVRLYSVALSSGTLTAMTT